MAIVVSVSAGQSGASEEGYQFQLDKLISRAEEQVQAGVPLRAEIQAKIRGLEGDREDRAVLFVRDRNGEAGRVEQYLEFRDSGVRMLIVSADQVYLRTAEGTSQSKLAAEVPGTSSTVEDWLPLSDERCGTARVADATVGYVTFTCELPPESGTQYSLVVYKVDRERAVPDRVMYYRDTLNNLVKIRQQKDFVQIASRWRPGRIVFQDFTLRTKDELELEWSEAKDLPVEVFDPKTLEGPSPVKW